MANVFILKIGGGSDVFSSARKAIEFAKDVYDVAGLSSSIAKDITAVNNGVLGYYDGDECDQWTIEKFRVR